MKPSSLGIAAFEAMFLLTGLASAQICGDGSDIRTSELCPEVRDFGFQNLNVNGQLALDHRPLLLGRLLLVPVPKTETCTHNDRGWLS